jgi:hypothetical protein
VPDSVTFSPEICPPRTTCGARFSYMTFFVTKLAGVFFQERCNYWCAYVCVCVCHVNHKNESSLTFSIIFVIGFLHFSVFLSLNTIKLVTQQSTTPADHPQT